MGRVKPGKAQRRTRGQRIESRMARAVFETDRRENVRQMFSDIFGTDATDEQIAEQIVSGEAAKKMTAFENSK